MKEKFNIEEFTSDYLDEGNLFSRIYNNVVKAINIHTKFPKIILIILDSDIVRAIRKKVRTKKLDATGIGRLITNCIDCLICDLHRLIFDHKELLPKRAVRFKYPTCIWMIPPGHTNFDDNVIRKKLAETIEKSVLQFNEMRFLRMKATWDYNEMSLVIPTVTGYRFTSKGLLRYWISIDEAVNAWEVAQRQTTRKQTKTGKGNAPHPRYGVWSKKPAWRKQ